MGKRVCLVLAAVGCWVASAGAQEAKQVWEEYGNRISESRTIGTLGPDLMGDQVNLANGALSFSVTDVSLAGNSALPVAFTRTLSVSNRYGYDNDAPLADWSIDLPNVSGVFAPDWVVFKGATPFSTARCSSTGSNQLPSNLYGASPEDYWNGNQLNIPGVGGGELLVIGTGVQRPTDGPTYHWVAQGNIFISCLGSIQNGAGEGFRAITPDGTTYLFNWMGTTHEPNLVDADGRQITRKKRALYATHVEDRFGNWVKYSYANTDPNDLIRLTRIWTNDDRELTVSYGTNGHVSSVTEASASPTRSWTYQYGQVSGYQTLTRVVRPDESTWEIALGALGRAEVETNLSHRPESCWFQSRYPGKRVSGSVTHPSGAVGTFEVDFVTHNRSNVPAVCAGQDPSGTDGIDTRTAVHPASYQAFSLVSKQLTGPGLAPMEWEYAYDSLWSVYWPSGTPGVAGCPGGVFEQCRIPVCTDDSCAGTATTTVSMSIAGTDQEWLRYTHGNSFNWNEGKLLKVESGASATSILRTQTHTYDLSHAAMEYPARFGSSHRWAGWTEGFHSPRTGSIIAQQGETFAHDVEAFDSFARPLTVKRWSSLGHERTETTAYHDNFSKWVLGQVASVREHSTNTYPLQLTYHPISLLPATLTRFGLLEQSYTYAGDGTLSTVTDGRLKTYTLSNYSRGIPRSIAMPGGASMSAVVNTRGEITSVTDPMGYTTHYGYDPMGRLASIQYPANDSVAWATTTLSFARHTSAEYGLPLGHWRQEISTGNARQVTHFDAFWRPVVTREFDNSAVPATQRFTVRRFDHGGRETFVGYPTSTLNNFATVSAGVTSTYDAIGRLTRSRQTSEQGALDTNIAYLSQFRKRVTNPRNQSTTYEFQAFDSPAEDAPVLIQAPANQNTQIVRDVFGKPLSLRRYGNWNGSELSLTRRYVYDAQQRLCKRIEPESGAAVFAYDAANNIDWSAEGTPLTTLTCNRNSVPVADRTTRTYDDRNRPFTVNFPGHAQSLSFTYYADGALHTAVAGDVSSTYQYNRRRLLTREIRNIDGRRYDVDYTYNARGELASMTHPDGEQTLFAPNALGQSTRVGNFATNVAYLPSGAVSAFTYGNGVTHVAETNARQLLSNLTYGRNGSLLLSQELSYDANANVTQATDLLAGAQRSRSMQYDAADRLTSANAPGLWGTESFAYDPLDNLRTVTRGAQVRTYHYDGDNLLTEIGVGANTLHSYAYDARGNVMQRDGELLDFDHGNRLRSVGLIADYDYDAQGRRARRVEDGKTSHFLYTLAGQMVFEHGVTEQTYAQHHYLGNRLVARETGVAAAPASAPVVSAPEGSATGSYTVSWTAVAGTRNYRLQERVNGGSWTNLQFGSATSRSFSGKANGTYDYRVRAENAFGFSALSAVKTVIVMPPPASAPTLTAPATNSTGSYTVSWTSVTAATRYELEERLNSGGWSQIQDTSALSRALSGKASGNWGYRVRACNVGGCSAYSSIGTTVVTRPPTATTTITAPSPAAAAGFTVTWGSVATATRYELEQRPAGGAWSKIHDGAAMSHATGPRSAGTYEFRVRGCNAGGCAGYSPVRSVVVPPPPPGVGAPSVHNLGWSCDVNWSSSTGATSYQVQNQGGAIVYDGPATYVSLSGACGPQYTVRACGLGGCSGWSPPGHPGGGGDPHIIHGTGQQEGGE